MPRLSLAAGRRPLPKATADRRPRTFPPPQLAVGYTLDQIPNDITRKTPASFEPSIDYIITKIPKFNFEKFPGSKAELTTMVRARAHAKRACGARRRTRAKLSVEDGVGLAAGSGRPEAAGRERRAGSGGRERACGLPSGFKQGGQLRLPPASRTPDPAPACGSCPPCRRPPQMKSVGEVMAIGRTWQESFQKALRGMEAGLDGWSLPK